tara:strand:- start:53 stop:232 length:180 start_codon:yes stop_codon:yes gene_type:complete
MKAKVGDLVRVLVGEHKEDFPLGMVIGFDEDDDPIVIERGQKLPHYRSHLEVIHESKSR